jgi:speckle-type POZ protein
MQTSKTKSTWNSGTEQGTHVFHICGYSQGPADNNNAAGEKSRTFISSIFPAGGYHWAILFRPDSIDDKSAAGIALSSRHVKKLRASYELRLVDRSTGLSVSVHKEAPREFQKDIEDPHKWISYFLEKRSIFESPTYLRDDCLTMECTVTVIKEEEPRRTETKPIPKIQVPPSDMAGHYAILLEEKVGVDVTFSVGGEEFTAHKVVLATRSPVFKAQLYGPLREAGSGAVHITIQDMQPAVFRELLHFIYTDSLVPLDYLKADARTDMIRHLLVAADRYGMERLSLMCQSILCENLSVQTVATTFALADQHQCDILKDACLEFITCSTAMDAVKRTQGYRNLKRTCPPDVIQVFEKASRFRKA